ncbi:MAG TPA: Holliday junction branch migration protein RuvA [Niabella sp.]|nr:Holliday junction branch migration protein RuvA [Niabella sp.]HOZ97683.1 Holliday junction branch migration protein RuvA [Niabella sp.]HQW13989.1 Holliday junction branch migration protein RuvA [Niabella sp.]HQX19468.1 Holliday junction branch migration protein RuvA [Niabella sp.]HQX40179.1 Holliday junction branch migration protein RuvA [Niabella sp.]
MIAYLKGKFFNISPSAVIVDVQGIGYEVNISVNTFTKIQDKESGLLFTHLIIREDAHLLFGFADAKEKDIFLQLLTVSGIGANTARLILSYMKPEEVSLAIINGDSKSLEKVKGIGKKTAERAVLELRDKIGKQYPEITISPNHQFVNTIKQDALEALQALGINRQMAEQHVIKILQTEPELQVEALIKKVLKGI